MFKQIHNIKGFTLVELIVVITIVSILSTVGFVAYVDYLKGARDSSRVQQLGEIHNALSLYATRSKLPLPNSGVSIVSGAKQIGTQGIANTAVLDEIKYSDGGKDPKTKDFFTYFVSKDRKTAQLLAFFEEDQALSISNQTYADYSNLYPYVYGTSLGVLIDSSTQAPIQKLEQYTSGGTFDILTQTGSYTSFSSNTESVTGSGELLLGMVPDTDCKKLQSIVPSLESGIYKINPTGIKQVDVYCEMDDDTKGYGNGWTLVARTHINGGSLFGWLQAVGAVYDDTAIYSMGNDVKDIRFSEIMIATYDTGKNITSAMTMDINNVFFQSGITSPETSISLQEEAPANCQLIYNGAGYTNDGGSDNCNGFKSWGAFGYTSRYIFGKKLGDGGGGLYSKYIDAKSNGMRKDKDTGGDLGVDNLRREEAMLFVR